MESRNQLFSFLISCRIKRRDGGSSVFFRQLRQATHSLPHGKLFTKKDHKYLIYLANSSIPKLVGETSFQSSDFLVQHIPGVQKVVVDGLTTVMSLSSVEIPRSKRHMFVEDCIPRIFWLGVEGMMIVEIPRDIEGKETTRKDL